MSHIVAKEKEERGRGREGERVSTLPNGMVNYDPFPCIRVKERGNQSEMTTQWRRDSARVELRRRGHSQERDKEEKAEIE